MEYSRAISKEIMHEFEFETGNPLEIPLINPSVQNSIDLSWETNDSMLICMIL